MADLSDLRNEIDKIDEQLVALYEMRMETCRQIAEVKIDTGRKVFDKERESSILEHVKQLSKSDFTKKGSEELFQQILSMSRKLQYQKLMEHGAMGKLPFIEIPHLDTNNARICFQGAEGAYSQAAMLKFFGEDINCFHVDTFRDAMVAIEEGSADYAVLPIENSSAGIVNEIYDLLVEFENYIVGEQIIKIEHCLMALPGTKMEDIQTVYSHPQSLMQSNKFLQEHASWSQISMKNNAFAAQKVLKDNDHTKAAIASEHAAKIYGLEVLKKGVNYADNNSTRFIVVTNQKVFLKDAGKISICFEIPHESGSLYRLLSHFIYNDLNMCKIESRPIPERNWEYRFFVDFEGNMGDSAVKNAIRGLRDEGLNLKILGNY